MKDKKLTKKKTSKKKAAKKKSIQNVGDKVTESVKPENNKTPIKKKSRGGKNYVKTGVGVGGARKGSGRKKGAATKRTREIADKLAEEGGVNPLSYMLSVLAETPEAIKKRYDAGAIDSTEYLLELTTLQKRKDNAAEKAAPYLHARLSSIEAKVTNSSHEKWVTMLENEDE